MDFLTRIIFLNRKESKNVIIQPLKVGERFLIELQHS
jgi:hypothetical protein